MLSRLEFYRVVDAYGEFSNVSPHPIEHTKNDVYWAGGGDGRGRNRLGELLMELRSALRYEDVSPEAARTPEGS